MQPLTAAKSCTNIASMLRMPLRVRVTFGGTPNPSQWSDVSEVVTEDLANDLVKRDDWDPTDKCAPQRNNVIKTFTNDDSDKPLITPCTGVFTNTVYDDNSDEPQVIPRSSS